RGDFSQECARCQAELSRVEGAGGHGDSPERAAALAGTSPLRSVPSGASTRASGTRRPCRRPPGPRSTRRRTTSRRPQVASRSSWAARSPYGGYWQVPLTQLVPGAHWKLQLPQLESVFRLISHPSASVMLQSAKPALRKPDAARHRVSAAEDGGVRLD